MKKAVLALCAVLICVSHVHAQFDLQITEMFPGNDPGANLTADWFEITNFGNEAFESANDGFLFFDDESQSTADAVGSILNGILAIAPGESVVFIDDTDTTEFGDVWANLTLPQLGLYDGSGLGGGGDGVALFIAPTDSPAESDLVLLDFEEYPDTASNGGQTFDAVLSEFSTVGNASGAVQSALSNDEGQFAVGSPGLVAVPEPATGSLIGLVSLGLIIRRRK